MPNIFICHTLSVGKNLTSTAGTKTSHFYRKNKQKNNTAIKRKLETQELTWKNSQLEINDRLEKVYFVKNYYNLTEQSSLLIPTAFHTTDPLIPNGI